MSNENNKEEVKEEKQENKVKREGVQNRITIVLGIVSILVSIFGAVIITLANYVKNLNIPIGNIIYNISYIVIAVLIGILITYILNTIVYLYYEMKKGDLEEKEIGNISSKADKMYHSIMTLTKFLIVIFLLMIFLLMIFGSIGFICKNSSLIYYILIGVFFGGILIVLFIRKFNRLIGLNLLINLIIIAFLSILSCIFLKEYSREISKLNVNFNENGVIQIDKESLDKDGIEVKITYWNNVNDFLWYNKFDDKEGIEGYSGIFINSEENKIEAEIDNARHAIWNKAKVYYHHELDLKSYTNQNEASNHKRIGDMKEEYIVTILVDKGFKKIAMVNRFKVEDGKFIFAIKQDSIEY